MVFDILTAIATTGVVTSAVILDTAYRRSYPKGWIQKPNPDESWLLPISTFVHYTTRLGAAKPESKAFLRGTGFSPNFPMPIARSIVATPTSLRQAVFPNISQISSSS
ncbi:MAG: hypothetical protein ACRC62_18850 [Microcoleus sp.]